MIDLDSHGKRFIASSGGKGGIGNVERRNLPRNKVNSTELRKGTKGGEREFEFELKCPAEVALVGFPNAGKSTLLAAVMPLIQMTRAFPKIAPYPFTTLHPHIGKLRFQDEHEIKIGDLPGLIEGAHMNKGLGHKFLKHIERTRVLVFVLDGSNSLSGERNAMNDLAILEKELELFKKDYSSKRRIIAVNKSDVDKEVFEMNFEEVKYKRTCDLIIPISARTGWNLSELVNSIRKIMEETSK